MWSAGQLRARLLKSQEALHSLYVVYRTGSQSYRDPEYPPGSYLHRIVAANAAGCLYHVSAHGHDQFDWQDDPRQQRCHVTPDHWYNVDPVNRTYSEGALRPEDALPGSMPDEFFFAVTGLWPFARRPPARVQGEPYMLKEVALSEEYSIVRPRQEMIDGHWCHVLQRPEVDRLWIDANRGCAVLARETHSLATGALVQRYELGGHRQVAPGIWLPTRVRNIQYDHTAKTAEGRKRKIKDAMLHMLQIKANDVDESVFEYQPPAGALLLSGLASSQQTRPGGLDHLDNLVRWINAYFPPAQLRVSLRPAYVSLLLAISVMAVWEISLRCGRKRSALEPPQSPLPGPDPRCPPSGPKRHALPADEVPLPPD